MTTQRTYLLIARSMSHAALQYNVLDACAKLGVQRWCHFRPARTVDGWRTAVEGKQGFPDIAMAHGGRVLFAELKRHGDGPEPDQQLWLDAMGAHGRLWWPMDWLDGTVLRDLTALVEGPRHEP